MLQLLCAPFIILFSIHINATPATLKMDQESDLKKVWEWLNSEEANTQPVLKQRAENFITYMLTRLPDSLQHQTSKSWFLPREVKHLKNDLNIFQRWTTERAKQQITFHKPRPDQQCPLCLCQIEPDDDIIKMKCHHLHFECFQPGIQALLDQDELDKLLKCPAAQCQHSIPLPVILRGVTSPTQVLRIQRALIRSCSGVNLCPGCALGTSVENKDHTPFCTFCRKDFCFQCGEKKHPNLSCDLASKKDQLLFMQTFAKMDSSRLGLCPSCGIIIEKKDGCPSMICGQNGRDKKQLRGRSQRGCGISFSWSDRIPIQKKLDQENISPTADYTKKPIKKFDVEILNFRQTLKKIKRKEFLFGYKFDFQEEEITVKKAIQIIISGGHLTNAVIKADTLLFDDYSLFKTYGSKLPREITLNCAEHQLQKSEVLSLIKSAHMQNCKISPLHLSKSEAFQLIEKNINIAGSSIIGEEINNQEMLELIRQNVDISGCIFLQPNIPIELAFHLLQHGHQLHGMHIIDHNCADEHIIFNLTQSGATIEPQ